MRFLHTADLHLGKRLCARNLEEDQEFILNQIADLAEYHRANAVLLAGDIFDRMNPSSAAVGILDRFLTRLYREGRTVLAVSGNHDSPERIAYVSGVLSASGVHLAGGVEGELKKVTLEDEWGPVHFTLLPYVRPANAPEIWPGCESLSEGIAAAIGGINTAERNVLVTHQNALPDSVDTGVSEPDRVDPSLFAEYDYAALGHIHKGMHFRRPETRFSGAPLAMDADEADRPRSVVLVTMEEKGNTKVEELPLFPLRPLRSLKGSVEELAALTPTEDYMVLELTDPDPVMDAARRLEVTYPNYVRLNWVGRVSSEAARRVGNVRRPVNELFMDFFRQCNGREMNDREIALLTEALSEAEIR